MIDRFKDFLVEYPVRVISVAVVRASDISRGHGAAKFQQICEIPQNSQKHEKYRQIR